MKISLRHIDSVTSKKHEAKRVKVSMVQSVANHHLRKL
jgi:hypothetical protein